jgi:hypothetical protein
MIERKRKMISFNNVRNISRTDLGIINMTYFKYMTSCQYLILFENELDLVHASMTAYVIEQKRIHSPCGVHCLSASRVWQMDRISSKEKKMHHY